MTSRARIDHLVVLAATLDEGVQWCEATLGVAPGPGGEHALMGTHNRLLRIAGPGFARAYLEVIAVRPGAVPERAAPLARWFDMDDEAVQASLEQGGPRLAHFVAEVPDADAAVQALAAQDIERGPAIGASRMTPAGLLQWRITVRDDGARLFAGALPTLIQWGEAHPAARMADSGVTLQSLRATHPQAGALRAAYEAIGLDGVAVAPGDANLIATLRTPRGDVTLESKGL